MPEPSRPTPITRIRDGRWLAGVCRGVAEARELETAWLRLGFVALALLGGIGIALYIACWLIMPTRAESQGEVAGGRGAVWFAQALGACVGLLLLALAGAVGTTFGFGWIVFAVAAALLVGLLAVRRLGPAWPLLSVAALVLPSVAVAADGLSLTPSTRAAVVHVRSAAELQQRTFRSGLNTMVVDLRHTSLPRSGALTLHIHAGVRRTIVALPHDVCVHVRVRSVVNPLPLRLASMLSGRTDHLFGNVLLFGRLFARRGPQYAQTAKTSTTGPTLTVDFHSQGGSLYVRDYPDSVVPDLEPDWPGVRSEFAVRRPFKGRPSTALLRRQLAAWRALEARVHADDRQIGSLEPGPCGAR
jgi:phage shock protein PspC (stress-responsive transcriptional regulator)